MAKRRKNVSPVPDYAPLNVNFTESLLKLDSGNNELAKTVLYIHGLANKPPEPVLRCQWDNALFETRMGDRTRMAYWVLRERHGAPLNRTCADTDEIEVPRADAHGGFGAMSAVEDDEQNFMATLGRSDDEKQWLMEFNEQLQTVQVEQLKGEGHDIGALGLGDSLARGFTKSALWLMRRVFLGDAYDFFFKEKLRHQMERSLLDIIETGGAPFVIVAHSQGSMIAYNVLRQLSKEQCKVPLFVTIGSPLGLPMVKAVFEKWTKRSRLPFPPCVDNWINVANKGDVVALDSNLKDDIDRRHIKKFTNFKIDSPNELFGSNNHGSSGYLSTQEVRSRVMAAVGPTFAQPVGQESISPDLVSSFESTRRTERQPVLIELTEVKPDETLADLHAGVDEALVAMVSGGGGDGQQIVHLKRYVSASLTRSETERLRTHYKRLKIKRVWQDSQKQALINESTKAVQVMPAAVSYGAKGDGITWAVLDTGVRDEHPHFQSKNGGSNSVTRQWDCTLSAATPALVNPGDPDVDKNGHGTHVAGIIAGYYDKDLETSSANESSSFAGLAPHTNIVSYKVLNDAGRGQDSYVIKALDHIAETNENANRLVIQGVNLSLGGPFNPSVYGCGHTPICKELRRLWRQGVVVVIAAGNEGFANLQTTSGRNRPSNMDLSIGDPGNLEEAICVGSVHRTRPHTYGVSYFSSRGPTADGRVKPDVVAPGEKILSAWSGFEVRSRYELDDLYVQLSGTSMAAPHISGLIAAFLSVRREFIGYPDKVKEMLLESCTDIGRDRYLQGAGVPNLVKMLVMN